jgi:hypothetical protein
MTMMMNLLKLQLQALLRKVTTTSYDFSQDRGQAFIC